MTIRIYPPAQSAVDFQMQPGGIVRIVGMEAVDATMARFRAQAWHYKP